MDQDAIGRLAAARMIRFSAEIQEQMEGKNGYGPVAVLLNRARERAADAIGALVTTPPTETEAIRAHQNSVVLFDMLVEDLRWLIAAGEGAAAELTEEEGEELALLMYPPADVDEQYISSTLAIT